MYRCRIGSFNSSLKTQNSTGTTSSESKTSSIKPGLLLLLVTALCLSCTAVAIQAPSSQYSTHRYQVPLIQFPLSTSHYLPTGSYCPPSWQPPWHSPQFPSSSCLTQLNIVKPYCPPYSTITSCECDLLCHLPIIRNLSSWLTRIKRNSLIKSINGNRGQRGHGIKILHWNKGPSYLQNKQQEIETIIAGHQPHILGLSEANLWADHDQHLVQHADYNIHTCLTLNNPELSVSRVVVYTHQSLVVTRRHDLEDPTISSIWLEGGLPRQKKILVCNGYREWQHLRQNDNSSGTVQAQLQRWLIFLEKWEQALQSGREVIVLMDANLDFLKWSRNNLPPSDSTHRLKPLIQQLFSRIFPLGVSQLVTCPTRSWSGQKASGLDHIYSNKQDKLSEVYTEFAGGSDHKLIKVTRYAKSLKRSVRYVRKRCYKNFKDEQFSEAVRQLSWFDPYMCNDANQAAEILTQKLTRILDNFAPIKTIQVRAKYAAWLTDETKDLMKERNQAQDLAGRTQDADDWRRYKNLRNNVNARLKIERKTWEKKKLDGAQHDPSTLWKNVKGWLNWSNSGPPTQLFSDGKLINSPAGLAATMNHFFINKVTLLRHKIPQVQSDPLSKLRETMKDRRCTMGFRPVKPEEVKKIINGLKNSKSTGTDFIDTWIIKSIVTDVLPAITHIINLSLYQSQFPNIWKQAKVVPLLKSGDTLTPKNYRPVALLPILSKVLEKVVFLQIVEYLDSNNLVHPNHHGSRQGHSTATALLQMYDQWVEEVEDDKLVGVMMVDLSAAFDMVDHPLLLEKLRLFGLEENVLSWIQSYLTNRTQSVFIDGCLSPPLAVKCGVPQGSILGPLMYILFTNDVPDLVHGHPINYKEPQPSCSTCGGTVCYVDDSTYSFGHSCPTILSNTLTQQYNDISNYMAANKLVINDDKTHLVVMGRKKMDRKRQEVTLQAGQHIIKPSCTEKLLGGIISQDLKWKEHIIGSEQSMIRQLTSRINGLCMISSRAPSIFLYQAQCSQWDCYVKIVLSDTALGRCRRLPHSGTSNCSK